MICAMTGLLLLLLLLAALAGGLEAQHRHSHEAELRRVRRAAPPGRPWWPPAPVVRRS
jgi:hypothetical protein